MPTLNEAKAVLKDKVNTFKEQVFPALYANPATRQNASDTLNHAALVASESESLDEVLAASAALDSLI